MSSVLQRGAFLAHQLMYNVAHVKLSCAFVSLRSIS